MKKLDLGNGNKLEYSSCISCTWKIKYMDLEIYLGRDSHNVPYATTNLQRDYSNFESIAFCVWAIHPECKITLKYEPIKWYEQNSEVFPLDYENYDISLEWIAEKKRRNKKETDSVRARMQHYMRFLYRVMKMMDLYGRRFGIDASHEEECKVFSREFKKRLETRNFIITEPTQKGGLKGTSKISENHLEKWFVCFSGTSVMEEKCPEFIKANSDNIKLYDQFPCGLFAGSKKKDKSEKNRIFNSGAFDLWGVDKENNLCLYELKELNNTHLGILSELFFYSCLMSDMKKIAPDNGTDKRGFSEFLQANNKINAYFLVPGFHSFIDGQNLPYILSAMNARADNVKYDVIKFCQEKIVGEDVAEFIKEMELLSR